MTNNNSREFNNMWKQGMSSGLYASARKDIKYHENRKSLWIICGSWSRKEQKKI